MDWRPYGILAPAGQGPQPPGHHTRPHEGKAKWEEREHGNKSSSVCWFTPHLSTKAETMPKLGASSRSATWVQRLKYLGHSVMLSQANYQGAGAELEQPLLEPATIWDADTAGCCSVSWAPSLQVYVELGLARWLVVWCG